MSRRSTIDQVALLAALGSSLVGAWLLVVTRTVLSSGDPGMIGIWTVAAVGFLAYAVFTVLLVLRDGRSPSLRWSAVALSVVAVAIGGYLIASMLAATEAFEGYLLLMGLVLAGHGAVVLVREVAPAPGRRMDA